MATMATLDDAAEQRPRRLAESLVGELLGQVGDPLLGALHEVLIADPVADEGQSFELADRLGELLGELLDLGDRPRSEDGDDERRRCPTRRRPTPTTARPRRTWKRRTRVLTTASRARAISTPMPIRVSIDDELRTTARTARTTSTAMTTARNVDPSSRNRGASRAAGDGSIASGDAIRAVGRAAHDGDDAMRSCASCGMPAIHDRAARASLPCVHGTCARRWQVRR